MRPAADPGLLRAELGPEEKPPLTPMLDHRAFARGVTREESVVIGGIDTGPP